MILEINFGDFALSEYFMQQLAQRTTDERLAHLVEHSEGISRTEVAAALGLASPTVTSAVRRLLDDGAVVERPLREHRAVAGRRPNLLYPVGPRRALGLIVWRRETFELVIAGYGGQVLARNQISAPSIAHAEDDAMIFADAIEGLGAASHALRPRTELTTVVVSVPAPFQQGVGSVGQRLPVRRRSTRAIPPEQAGGPTFYAGLAGDPAAPLSKRFGVAVYLENNANLAALGEFSAGAGRGHPDQLFVLLNGQSIGSGVIANGRLVRGATGYAGELAHVQVDEDGPLCACGGRGCLGTHLGAGLLASVQSAYAQPVTFPDLLAMAARGDAGPARILADLGRVVGRPIADVCSVLNPGVVVVDGRLGAAADFVVDGIREQIERFTPPAIGSSMSVVAGQLDADASVHGAIHLARAGR
jgi:predicted NBD/HSP70 family sugar kinase